MKIIDFQIKDENRYSSDNKPRYVASIRIKNGSAYIGVEDVKMPEDFNPADEGAKQQAIRDCVDALQSARDFLFAQVEGGSKDA